MNRIVSTLLCRGVRIGYISDIHIECTSLKKALEHLGPERHTHDVLVLAGDIGDPFCRGSQYQRFLSACTTRAKHTLVVAGNHEYYQGRRYSMAQTNCKIQSICDTLNKQSSGDSVGKVHFLNNRVFDFKKFENDGGIRFIGTTLWSSISKEHEQTIYNSINDYNLIMGFHPKLSTSFHQSCSHFINTELAALDRANDALSPETPKMEAIVVSHHAPSTHETSQPHYKNSPLSSAFATDFEYQCGKVRPFAWIFGHTHYNVHRWDKCLRTFLLSTQVGYPGEFVENCALRFDASTCCGSGCIHCVASQE